jgi:hypothetical protein
MVDIVVFIIAIGILQLAEVLILDAIGATNWIIYSWTGIWTISIWIKKKRLF